MYNSQVASDVSNDISVFCFILHIGKLVFVQADEKIYTRCRRTTKVTMHHSVNQDVQSPVIWLLIIWIFLENSECGFIFITVLYFILLISVSCNVIFLEVHRRFVNYNIV